MTRTTAPRRRRKPHPADLADARRIAGAVGFVAHFRRGPTESYRADAPTLAEARAAAARLNAAHGGFGRRAAVYAITPEGTAIIVPAGYPED